MAIGSHNSAVKMSPKNIPYKRLLPHDMDDVCVCYDPGCGCFDRRRGAPFMTLSKILTAGIRKHVRWIVAADIALTSHALDARRGFVRA